MFFVYFYYVTHTHTGYIYYIKLCAWSKNSWHQQEESTNERLEELNRDTYVCNVCLENNVKVYFFMQIQTNKIDYIYLDAIHN